MDTLLAESSESVQSAGYCSLRMAKTIVSSDTIVQTR